VNGINGDIVNAIVAEMAAKIREKRERNESPILHTAAGIFVYNNTPFGCCHDEYRGIKMKCNRLQ